MRVMEASRQANPPLSLGGSNLLFGYSRSQSLRLSHRPADAPSVSVPSARARAMGPSASEMMAVPAAPPPNYPAHPHAHQPQQAAAVGSLPWSGAWLLRRL